MLARRPEPVSAQGLANGPEGSSLYVSWLGLVPRVFSLLDRTLVEEECKRCKLWPKDTSGALGHNLLLVFHVLLERSTEDQVVTRHQRANPAYSQQHLEQDSGIRIGSLTIVSLAS